MIPSWQIPVLEDLATTYASCGIFDISTDQLSDFVAKQVQHEQRLPENRRLGYSRLQGAILVNPTRIAERVNNIIRHKLTENVIPGEYAEITEDCLIHSFRFTSLDHIEVPDHVSFYSHPSKNPSKTENCSSHTNNRTKKCISLATRT